MNDERYYVRLFTVFFAFVNTILIAFFVAFPIQDLIYSYPISSGKSVYLPYSFAWWTVFVFVIANFILPMILFGVVAGSKNPSRADLHSIATVVVIIINGITLILTGICYAFFINTSYSGIFPFNDPRWCCKYVNIHPELCPNTLKCLPDTQLIIPDFFIVIFVFVGVFTIFSFVHLGFNRLLRITNSISNPKKYPEEGKLLGVIVAFIYIGLYAYWCAWPLWNTIFVYGYPLLGIPPSPGNFVELRESYWQWWFLWMLVSNIAPPIIFLGALGWKKSSIVTQIHFWGSALVGLVTSVSFIVLLCILIGDCNWSWSAGSICNDYRWCCNYYAFSYAICGNVTPCPEGTINLYPNADFVQTLVISGFFTVLSWIEVWLNIRMIKYGIFK